MARERPPDALAELRQTVGNERAAAAAWRGSPFARASDAVVVSIEIKPSKRGSLHTALGVPQGQKIPASKLAAALRSKNAGLRKKANFARNAKSFNH